MILFISDHARKELTLNRSMEFGGPGLASLSMDERATLCNMATECGARTRGICEADAQTIEWMMERRPGMVKTHIRERMVAPDDGTPPTRAVLLSSTSRRSSRWSRILETPTLASRVTQRTSAD